MADIQLLLNKLNQAKPKEPVVQQETSPITNKIDLLKNKLGQKSNKVRTLSEELKSKVNNYNTIKGTLIVNKPEGFTGFTDIAEVENNADLYKGGFSTERVTKKPGTFMDGIKGFGNDILYGYLSSVSSFYHTLSNIPGGLNKLSKYATSKFGKSIEGAYQEDNEEGVAYALDVAESYLKDLSAQYNPHSENPYFNTKATYGYRPEDPDTFVGKITSAVGASPVTIGEYVAPTKLLKSAPLGFAATDALRELDKGLEEAAIAGGKGYLLGRIMKTLEPFNMRTRVTAMGTLGYGVTDGDFEDKMVGGITFGALSAMGNLQGKSLKDAKSDLNSYLSGKNYQQNKYVKELELETSKQFKVIENKAKEYTELNEQFILAKDALNKGEKTLGKREINSMEKRLNKLEGEIFTLRDNYSKANAHVEMSKEYLDLRSVQQVVSNLLKPEKVKINKKTKKKEYEYAPTEKDIQVKGFKGIINEAIFQLAPARFVSKTTNSLFKKGVDLVTQNRIASENTIDSLLRNPVFQKDNPYFVNVIKGLSPKGKTEISVLPANQYAKTGRHPDSIEAILQNNSKYLNQVVETLPAIEKFATTNKKNNRLYSKKEGDLTNKALRDNFNFNDNQILVYKTLRRGLKESLKFYNEMGSKYGGPEFQTVKELPSYFPHIWMADYRIFVRKKSNNELISVLPASNKATAKIIQKAIEKKLGDVKTKTEAAQHTGDMTVSAFAETMVFLRNNKSLAKEVRDAWEANYIKTGFNIHKMPRKQKFVSGYLGGNAKLYKDLGVPESIARLKNTSEFVRGYMAYIQGAIRSGHQIKLRRELKDLTMDRNISKHYSNSIELLNRYYNSVFSGDFTALKKADGKTHPVDLALEKTLGKFLGANGIDRFVDNVNSFTLTTRLLMYNMRFALAQVIQPYQMILPQLSRMRAIGEGGSPMEAFFKSQKDLIAPSKEAKEVIQEAVKNRNISAQFLNEFNTAIRGKSFEKFDKFIGAITGKGFSGRLEQFSRMNATLMFYHSLREGGMSHKMAKDRAWQLSDTYMVEYNATQRPMLYTSSGLFGRTAGRTFGLFKTFQHNYLAQMVEHVRTTQKTGDIGPVASFTASMIFTAGMYGVIGIESADFLLSQLDKSAGAILRKIGILDRDQRIPTLSDWLYENEFHPYLLFGVPSAVLNADLTATLAAPTSVGIDAIFQMPAGVQLALNISTATKTYVSKKLEDIETEGDKILFHTSYAPNILKPVIEAYYNAQIEGETIVEYLKDAETGNNGTVIVGAGQKVRAKVNRDLNDWYRRLFSTYSLEEAYLNKALWHLTKMKNRTAMKDEDWTEYAAISMLKGGGIPDEYIDYSVGQGYNADRIILKLKNKIKDLTTDVIEKNLKGDITEDKKKIADILINDSFKID